MITMNPVKSSTIKEVGYQESTQTLVVKFMNEKKYEYSNVPNHIYLEFVNSSSKGQYFIKNIRDNYPCIRLPQ